MADLTGKAVSHYKILERIGQGGMGTVYKAEDTKLKRHVALKFLTASIFEQPEQKSRFSREAQAAAALDHPNIATVYEIQEMEDGQTFIAMAYIQGQTLKHKIEAGQVDIETAADIALQIAEGLQEAHTHGVIHRDIKSANIMVAAGGRVQITDFGLARFQSEKSITGAGTQLGTPRYMSPEQVQGEGADHQSDIFSFGVVLYELLAGKLPFEGEHDQAAMFSILYDEPVPLSDMQPPMPEELSRIVSKALEKDKARRYQNIGQMLADLQHVKRAISVESQETIGMTAESRDLLSGRKKISRRWVAAVGSLVVLLLLFGIFRTFDGQGRQYDSIAVLPLGNLSNNPEQAYFVEGMHEALISNLAKIEALKVISRTSVMRYGKTDKSAPDIARELDVDVLVEGSVLRVGDTVRIYVQLIDGSSDVHIWEGSYDRDMRSVLAMLSEVAQGVADEIKVALSPEEKKHLVAAQSVNPKAHEAYLRGRYFFNRFNFETALEHFRQAVAIDSNLALGWSGLAAARALLAYTGKVPPRPTMAQARIEALKALELDENHAPARSILGWMQLWSWEWAAAKSSFERALELNPNDVDALHGYGDYLTLMGETEQGLTYVTRSRDHDPFSPIWGICVANHLYMLHRYDEAIAEAERVLALAPEQSGNRFIAMLYWQKGRFEEGLKAYGKTWGVDPEHRQVLEQAYRQAGPNAAMAASAELLVSRSKKRYISSFWIAFEFARAQRLEDAFYWLERAYGEHSPELIYAGLLPDFDPMRTDPRFDDLLHRMRLPELELHNKDGAKKRP